MARRQSAWETLQERGDSMDQLRRDVVGDQQLKRTRRDEEVGYGGAAAVSVAAAIAALVVTYVALSFVVWGAQEVGAHVSDALDSAQASQLWDLGEGEGEGAASEGAGGAGPQQAPAAPRAHPLAPRPVPVAVSLLVATVLGLVVFARERRKVDAQNVLSRTDDINEHVEDSHIALPDEVFANYDVFPDAGAHSDRMPTVLVSHKMLSNKGLRPVAVTVRHEADSTDESGAILALKGEPVTDGEGNLVRRKLPMIDEALGERLYREAGIEGAAPAAVGEGLPARIARALWRASRPDGRDIERRRLFDATEVPYNPGGANRDKLGSYRTLADLINGDWELPDYEWLRPAGVYNVLTEPSNHIVLAMTRAGKGKLIIEPTLDMWSRMKRRANMCINDPKGELYRIFLLPFTRRGHEVVAINLMNPIKSDAYNLLYMAAAAARDGDFQAADNDVSNIANVFFPINGSEEDFWPAAANNVFKRAAYDLIDYYFEEEFELRAQAEREGRTARSLEASLDELWSHVSLYNCYQLFVQLSSKKRVSPLAEWNKDEDAGKHVRELRDSSGNVRLDKDGKPLTAPMGEDEKAALEARAKWMHEKLWHGQTEVDELTLFAEATAMMPRSSLRTRATDVHMAINSMSGSDRTTSSVYGIALTTMSFFTNRVIQTLTSGPPSSSIDLSSFAFPRQLGCRLHQDFVRKLGLTGLRASWDAFADDKFTRPLEGSFTHNDMVGATGWASFLFDGIFPENEAYVRCRIINPRLSAPVQTLYFHFTKDWRKTADGRRYVVNPITREKVVRDGVLEELVPRDPADLSRGFRRGQATFQRRRFVDDADGGHLEESCPWPIVRGTHVSYTESPKALFMVTPPHLSMYSKIVLVLVNQLFNKNVESAYLGKSDQKPLYATFYMIDEAGNCQSEGKGIPELDTKLAIGAGQLQFFTLILQSMQQTRALYGDSIDEVLRSNSSAITFLKSNDVGMLEQLEKMSGTTHAVNTKSKSVERDSEALMREYGGRVSLTQELYVRPVIEVNDMLNMADANSIVLQPNKSPIWNRNETALPFSYVVQDGEMRDPENGCEPYTLMTTPTVSAVGEFDVLNHIPDFEAMLEKRLSQAVETSFSLRDSDKELAKRVSARTGVPGAFWMAEKSATEEYKERYQLTQLDFDRMDVDVRSEDIMEIVNKRLRDAEADERQADKDLGPEGAPGFESVRAAKRAAMLGRSYVDERAKRSQQEVADAAERWRESGHCADGEGGWLLTNEDLVAYQELQRVSEARANGQLVGGAHANHSHDAVLSAAYDATKERFAADRRFHQERDGSWRLMSADRRTCYVELDEKADARARRFADAINEGAQDALSKVHANGEADGEQLGVESKWRVHDSFYLELCRIADWSEVAGGAFEAELTRLLLARQQDGEEDEGDA